MSPAVSFQPLLPFEEETAVRAAPPRSSVPEPATPRPSAGAGESALVEALAAYCRTHPLDEKVLVAPTLAIGHQTLECVAVSGTPWVRLRVETPRTLAHGLVGAALSREGARLLSRAQALALVERACGEALGPASYFRELAARPGLHRAVWRTLTELRAAGIDPEKLPARAFRDRRKHRGLRAVFRQHAEALAAGRFLDVADVVRRALDALEASGPGPGDATYLLPSGIELAPLERRLVERLAGERLVVLATDPPEDWTRIARRADLFRATGEENEIREVFRRVLAAEIPFDDVEILHTDAAVYPALVYELSREHGVPCTFAGGIPASYARPGRAALAFFDWIAQDFAAEALREALASGTLRASAGAPGDDATSARSVAEALREAEIGWGRDRHRRCLERRILELERPAVRRRDADESPAALARRSEWRARRLEAAKAARAFVARALDLAPLSLDEPTDLRALAHSSREFVAEFARVADELDGTAKTALDALFSEFEELAPERLEARSAVARLRDAVAGLSIDADRPRPGHLHVAAYAAGGWSGRRRTFLVGLDDARHPGRDLEDPILLDEERRRINEELPKPALALKRDDPREAAGALRSCLARLRGELTASYSSFGLRDLSQAGEPAPSPFFLELFRESAARPDADYGDLAQALPAACGFVPPPDRALDETEWWLARRAAGGPIAAGVLAAHPWLADGDRAEAARASDAFTEFDGWVKGGTPELDPRSAGADPFSASRIQALASCPFSFFVRHVLRVEPPRDVTREPMQWLDPRDRGTLLHEVFRNFFERLAGAGEKPDPARHAKMLQEIADAAIADWRERVPPRSRIAFDEQRDEILFACRTLLARESEHCRDVTPRYFEVPFGIERAGADRGIASPDPVPIALGGGASFRLRGSVDRIDVAPDGTFQVWDYKTGYVWGIKDGSGLRGGRQIQPSLYAMAVDALLARAAIPGRVSRSGYFYPGRKGEGQRITARTDPAETRDVLTRLFDLLRDGLFAHAADEKDCRRCDLVSVCGGSGRAAERAERKLAATELPVLVRFREIHAEDD